MVTGKKLTFRKNVEKVKRREEGLRLGGVAGARESCSTMTTPGMTPGNETPAGHAFFIEQAKFSW